jgi:hypothetical protein
MKKFLLTITFFFAVTVGVLSIGGLAVDAGLKKSRLENFSEWNDIYQSKISSDVIVLGSSRAWKHVSPRILDSVLHVDVYNLGLDGYHFDMQYYRYQIFLQHNSIPNCILLCLDSHSLSKKGQLFMPEQFAPYLSDSLIKQATAPYEGFQSLDYHNPFTKYLYKTRYIATGLLELTGLKHFDSKKYKGYQGKNKPWDNSYENFVKKNPDGWTHKIKATQLRLMEAFLSQCRKSHVNVVFVYTPEYIDAQRHLKNRKQIFQIYTALSEKYHLPFLDYSNHELCTDKSNFYNSQHLNKSGAEKYSQILAHDLMKIKMEFN